MTSTSNVRLRTNVLCTRVRDESDRTLASRGPAEYRHALTYFELAALRRALPFLHESRWLEHDQLTPSQRAHRNAFLADYREPPWNPVLEGFSPMSASGSCDDR